jgi:hypothetical protein
MVVALTPFSAADTFRGDALLTPVNATITTIADVAGSTPNE